VTSSSVLSQGRFRRFFWKNEHDFLIVIHGNFLSAMHGFQDDEVVLPSGYDRGRRMHFFITDSERATITFWLCLFSYRVCFRDNMVVLPTGYHVIVSPQSGGDACTFSLRSLKERPWLPDQSIITFSLGCMVSGITSFYCQTDKTSSWVIL